MASSANKDNFVILNNMWTPVTTVNWAVDDKATTFAAYLNLGRVFKICEERKMEFKYRVTVNADDTVDLLAPPPTFANPGHEDASEFINLERFCQAVREAKTDIIFSGGVRTMSTTAAMIMDRFEQHWNLYNRFAALSIEEVEDVGDDDENGLLSTFACGRKKIQWYTSEQQLSKRPVKRAVTSDQVLERHNVAKAQRQILRDFYYSNASKREPRVAYRMKNRAWDLATSDERGYISGSSVPNAEPKSKQWRCWRKHLFLRPNNVA
ncbi:unnamed protein product [Umbelopsis vinacea]